MWQRKRAIFDAIAGGLMLHRRGFLVSSMAAAAAVSLPDVAFSAIRRFGKPRPAKNAEHGVVYRNENEFCAWPYTQGFFETGDGTLIANFIRTPADYGKVDSLNHNVVMRGGANLQSARSHDRGR